MLSGHHRATVASCALGPVRRRQLVGQATCAPISLSLLQLAVQLRFGAIGAFKLDVDLVALERERVPIYFAMPEDSSIHRERVVVEPTPFDGVDAIGGGVFSIAPIKADGARDARRRSVRPSRRGCEFP